MQDVSMTSAIGVKRQTQLLMQFFFGHKLFTYMWISFRCEMIYIFVLFFWFVLDLVLHNYKIIEHLLFVCFEPHSMLKCADVVHDRRLQYLIVFLPMYMFDGFQGMEEWVSHERWSECYNMWQANMVIGCMMVILLAMNFDCVNICSLSGCFTFLFFLYSFKMSGFLLFFFLCFFFGFVI